MAIKKTKLGSSLKQIGGLHLRIILNDKGLQSGEFGIYAGKNLYLKSTNQVELLKTMERCQWDSPTNVPYRKKFKAWQESLLDGPRKPKKHRTH